MKRQIKQFLTLICTLAISANLQACDQSKDFKDLATPPHLKPVTDKKAEGVTRLMTYNIITFRYSNAPDNYTTIANMMNEIEADVVCLNEVDKNTNRSGNIYQMEHFAKLMGNWDFVYGEAMPYDGGYYGEGLCTKETIVKRSTVPLPKGIGAEPRVLCVAEMEDYVITNTHLDHSVEAAHIGQVEAINAYIEENYGDYDKPIFLAGDLNAKPDSPTMKLLQEKWMIISLRQSTFPSNVPTSCIDYILQYKNGAPCEVVQSQVVRQFKSGDVTKTSDHLPVLVDVRLPAKNN